MRPTEARRSSSVAKVRRPHATSRRTSPVIPATLRGPRRPRTSGRPSSPAPATVAVVGFQWLVTVVLGTHFAYLAYLLLGGFLAWRWPAMIFPHLAAAVWGVLIVFNLVACPLTIAEVWARRLAGDQPVNGGFIDRYVTGVIYPGKYLVEARLAMALVILISY